MNEQAIRGLVEQVRQGRLPRRQALARLLAVGLSLPMASVLLMNAARAQVAGTPPAYKPTRRGGGGALRLLYWQGPTLLNPHFATGSKDNDGCRLFHEPLATWDADANLQPVLAAEIPSRENGGLAADGKTVVWKLKRGLASCGQDVGRGISHPCGPNRTWKVSIISKARNHMPMDMRGHITQCCQIHFVWLHDMSDRLLHHKDQAH